MVFNSYTFIVFFMIMLVLHNLPFLSWKTKKVNLLVASYIFYAAWNPPFVLLLWLSTIVDFFVGRALYIQNNKYKKRVLLVVSLIGNLGMLCFFKYGNFLLENFVAFVNLIGFNFHPAKPGIILPAGISFYTFTTLCYTIDMYKRKSEPVRSFLDFALFVTFFPHLVAGPIVRPPQLVPQFQHPHQATRQQLLQGLFLLSLGLFMKIVVADTLMSGTANTVFGFTRPLPGLDAWIGVLAFSGQIFSDFAGYSTCAIGVAMCLGFILPENFRYPYAAIGFTDFWRRWHITLSSWLRDYLYIPLGGNRKSEFRTYFNLMMTMLLGGLWHGASWTFVAWGALHGIYLCIEKWFRQILGNREKTKIQITSFHRASLAPVFANRRGFQNIILALGTFFLINVTWVFFRAKSFSAAWRLLKAMFGQSEKAIPLLYTIDIIKVSIVITIIFIAHWLMRNTSVLYVAKKIPWLALACFWAFLIISIIICQKSADSFIYFQF